MKTATPKENNSTMLYSNPHIKRPPNHCPHFFASLNIQLFILYSNYTTTITMIYQSINYLHTDYFLLPYTWREPHWPGASTIDYTQYNRLFALLVASLGIVLYFQLDWTSASLQHPSLNYWTTTIPPVRLV